MKYEYKVFVVAPNLAPVASQSVLNQLGRERWRLVSAHEAESGMILIFMRELKQEIGSVEGGLND